MDFGEALPRWGFWGQGWPAGTTLGGGTVRSPAGIALLSQRLLRGPQVALAPRRRLGGGLGAAAGLVTVLVAHGLDVAAAAHSPARDGALACGVRLARGQQRGGPFAAASGHLGLGGQPSARVGQGAAHTPSAPPATQPRAHHLGSELHARTPISRPLKLPRCPPRGIRPSVLGTATKGTHEQGRAGAGKDTWVPEPVLPQLHYGAFSSLRSPWIPGCVCPSKTVQTG